MNALKIVPGCVSCMLLLATAAAMPPPPPRPMAIVNVSSPAINCVFNKTCVVTVRDSGANFALQLTTGKAVLQTRTFTAAPGAPAAGYTAYLYRVDLSAVRPTTAFSNCVKRLTVDFGPVARLPYARAMSYAGWIYGEVFVITSGGLGTIGVSGAWDDSPRIILEFSKPIWVPPLASPAKTPGESSFFFGMASKGTPRTGTVTIYPSYGSSITVPIRAPSR